MVPMEGSVVSFRALCRPVALVACKYGGELFKTVAWCDWSRLFATVILAAEFSSLDCARYRLCFARVPVFIDLSCLAREYSSES